MRLADYVFRYLADQGVRHVFMVTGGGAMHLNDAVGLEPRVKFVCQHHEQACAMAAEGYARATGRVGVINVTTGPGGINSLNGVFGAYTDSIPLLVLSGQVKRETCLGCYDLPALRQLGDQEVDIIRMARGVTKYAQLVSDPETIRYHLERALHLATAGRHGPVWLDIPVDVQGSQIEPDTLRGYDPAEDAVDLAPANLSEVCADILARLKASERPVLMVGNGVRRAGAVDLLRRVIPKLGVPVTTSWSSGDLVVSDDPYHCGRPGTIGDRPGNFAVQNADTLLVVGSRLNVRQVSYNWPSFARAAHKIWVDIDPAELAKPTIAPDLPVVCDAGLFLAELERQLDAARQPAGEHGAWLGWCRERVARYPALQPHHGDPSRPLNPYEFVHTLFAQLGDDDIVACGNGAACVVPFQVAHLRERQMMFGNSGAASMGYDLPAAIGAAVGGGGRQVICLAGDGSVMMNLQELQTVVEHQLPLKLFVLNNGGYSSIRQTQSSFFHRLVGEGPTSGLSFPDFVAVGRAFGLPAERLERPAYAERLRDILAAPGPFVCEVVLDPEQGFEPKLSARTLEDGRIVSPQLEDLAPFLDRQELRSNIVSPGLGYDQDQE